MTTNQLIRHVCEEHEIPLLECKQTQKSVKEIKSVEKVKEIIKKWQIDIKEEPFRIKA